jgi:hypothetical protein
MVEPIFEVSRFAYDWAPKLCDPAQGCANYHGLWPLIRLIETDGALPVGKPFFFREIQSCSNKDGVHVLVSGGADTGVMALAVTTALAANIKIRVTAIDRCRTPLEQMRLYGSSCGVKVDIIRSTLDQIPAGLEADVIIGHSILKFISDEERCDVFVAWAGALRPGGKIVLSQRLSTGNASNVPSSGQHLTKDALKARRAALAVKLARFSPYEMVAPVSEILEAAEVFWTTPSIFANPNEEDILNAAAHANLDVISIQESSDTHLTSPFSFALDQDHRPRCEIILQKPPG